VNAQLLSEATRYVELQTLLVTEFCRCYPEARSALHKAPRTGCLSTTEGFWLFKKHGAGVSFVNALGVWVDPHVEFGSPDLFDAWRIHLYLESASGDDYPEPTELESLLNELVTNRKLVRCSERLFMLAEPPAVLPLLNEPFSMVQDSATWPKASLPGRGQ
jgi:uncharacterized protein DUF6896